MITNDYLYVYIYIYYIHRFLLHMFSLKHMTTSPLFRVLPANEDQWYVEDPFDLKHNLAGGGQGLG